MQDFIVVKIKTDEDTAEILQAELSEIEFDSFIDEEEGFTASLPFQFFDKITFDQVIEQYAGLIKSCEITSEKQQNWNALWESNYEAVEIADWCYIRAHFHPEKPHFKHQILITPKMSFGTGHHATTRMMLEHLAELDLQGKKVLDLGCGTAVLAIMAEKLGAIEVEGCDIDDWVIENALENVELNHAHATIFLGTVKDVKPNAKFDIVLANINLHVLRAELADYVNLLKEDSILLMSGFLVDDIEILEKEAKPFGLKLFKQKTTEKGNWASIAMQF